MLFKWKWYEVKIKMMSVVTKLGRIRLDIDNHIYNKHPNKGKNTEQHKEIRKKLCDIESLLLDIIGKINS